jgi:hypothetical protein
MELNENDNKIELLPILFDNLLNQKELVMRTEAEILDIISQQEKEEIVQDFQGFSISEFEKILKLEILDEARKLRIVKASHRFTNGNETVEDKLNILKQQKFAIWFYWDGLNIVNVERGLIVNIYIHTSAKDILHNKDIWHMIRHALARCHSRENGLLECSELELRTKMLSYRISGELRRFNKQVIQIEDREEEFDLVGNHRILAEESEIYQVILTDRITGIKAIGRGNIKFRNQIDWGTKLELSRKVREFEFSHRGENE